MLTPECGLRAESERSARRRPCCYLPGGDDLPADAGPTANVGAVARGVGYFDEGYAASQLWKADWEQVQGDLMVERAHAIVRQLDPMRQKS